METNDHHENTPRETLLNVGRLRVSIRKEDGGREEIVRGASFKLSRGESLALIGESGSGKAATALSLTRLLPEPPAKIIGGSVLLHGKDLLRMSQRQLRQIRGKEIAYIFKDPSTALNPVFTIRNQMSQILSLHRPDLTGKKDRDHEMIEWLYRVGIVDPENCLNCYPHQLSGSVQQRAMVAMAISCRPSIVVADEPSAALDTTICEHIFSLLRELKEESNLALLLLTNDLGTLGKRADSVAIISEGKIVEHGPTASILGNPESEITRNLLAAIPRLGAHPKRLPLPQG